MLADLALVVTSVRYSAWLHQAAQAGKFDVTMVRTYSKEAVLKTIHQQVLAELFAEFLARVEVRIVGPVLMHRMRKGCCWCHEGIMQINVL